MRGFAKTAQKPPHATDLQGIHPTELDEGLRRKVKGFAPEFAPESEGSQPQGTLRDSDTDLLDSTAALLQPFAARALTRDDARQVVEGLTKLLKSVLAANAKQDDD